ncbi:ADP-ribosylglycohydrolase family protein [Fusibacter paucivorans]|uniref:ADP-ribosylglycohydrolase family protein n=1 Tax=Fusibacter paucivorans TaxID=76009 RepID=A0ABS5PMR4_9FIRM|nr:ADP-ribosylglycohydrolase family protein [Fusibacter paucivorans]MBS7526485.1 ADP-ribosylglycohydrolase family protein [Fusibacter paucivorans]
MDKLRGLLFGAMIGDSFALPAHWIYDIGQIREAFSDYTAYRPTVRHTFHQNKPKGTQTHYGDQALLMLRSIASSEGFQLETYRQHWLHMMSNYEGYLDKATKDSLPLLKSGLKTGSASDDLGGFVMCAPLITYHFDDIALFDDLHDAIRMTHDSPALLSAADFITCVLMELVIGKTLVESLDEIAAAHEDGAKWLALARKHLGAATTDSIRTIGQSCAMAFALPSALVIVLEYPDDFMGAMRANVLAGGDSAARGMLIGMLLGAAMGIQGIPKPLIDGIACRDLLMSFTKHNRV